MGYRRICGLCGGRRVMGVFRSGGIIAPIRFLLLFLLHFYLVFYHPFFLFFDRF